ncbi:MAG: DUF4783 domain-containing protein [Chitinophagales bacterium]|nr:DUF4783 domain-containing protein [Chitinophagales bacterium]
MKNHNKFSSVLLLFAGICSIMAVSLTSLEDIATAIRNNDAKQLASYFDTMVEVKIMDKEGAYSKAQAEQIVKDFFAKNPVKNFVIKHDGPSGGNQAHYAIGALTSGATKYRTYIYMKKKGDTFIIQELSIENE